MELAHLFQTDTTLVLLSPQQRASFVTRISKGTKGKVSQAVVLYTTLEYNEKLNSKIFPVHEPFYVFDSALWSL